MTKKLSDFIIEAKGGTKAKYVAEEKGDHHIQVKLDDDGMHYTVHHINPNSGIDDDQLQRGDKLTDTELDDLQDAGLKVHIIEGVIAEAKGTRLSDTKARVTRNGGSTVVGKVAHIGEHVHGFGTTEEAAFDDARAELRAHAYNNLGLTGAAAKKHVEQTMARMSTAAATLTHLKKHSQNTLVSNPRKHGFVAVDSEGNVLGHGGSRDEAREGFEIHAAAKISKQHRTNDGKQIERHMRNERLNMRVIPATKHDVEAYRQGGKTQEFPK